MDSKKRERRPRRDSAESIESKELREKRGGTVSFGKEWKNFEYEVAPSTVYDRRTESRTQTDLSRRLKIQALGLTSALSGAAHLGLLNAGFTHPVLTPLCKVLPIGFLLMMVLTLGDRREVMTPGRFEHFTACPSAPIAAEGSLAQFRFSGSPPPPGLVQYGTRVALGLFFCAFGDVCLELEDPQSGSTVPFFIMGLGSGLIGHLAYTFAFYAQAPVSIATAALPVVAAGVVFNVLRPSLPADDAGPVVAYIVVACSMMALAFSRRPDDFSALFSWRCGSAGAIFFAVSDSLLAYDRFVAAVPKAKVLVAASYFVAQFLIALSARGSQPRPLSKALGSVENFMTGQGFRHIDDDN